jgi:hypothetical protein
MKPRPSAVIIGSVIALILASTFYTWRFSYFWLDDFNNLFLVQQQSLVRMLWYNVDPFTDFFRPFGMLVYWIFWHLFDLDPLPYHLFAWTLHVANVILLYVLLSRIVRSRYAAAVGALLFGFRANFTDIYWSFGTVFELLACLLALLALLIYTGRLRSRQLVLVGVLYLLAIKSKEMAITLPAVLLLYDVCLRRQKLDYQRKVLYAALAVLGISYGYTRFLGMSSESPANPYYMDFSILTLGRGYGWYFDHLYGMRLRWGAWMIASVLIFGLFMYMRERRGPFFLGYIFITLAPVVFLVNHRYEFFWYVPFLGIAGLAAVAVDTLEKRLHALMPARALEAAGLVLFAVLAVAHYVREKRTSAEILHNEQSLSEEYGAFVESLRHLPQPEPQGTVLIRSVPRHFTPEVLTSAVQVVLRRTDIRAEVVR